MSTNQKAAVFSFNFNGEEHCVRFENESIVRLETLLSQQLGRPVRTGEKPVSENDPFSLGLTGFFALIWAGLLWENPKLLFREVCRKFDGVLRETDARVEITMVLARAYAAAFGVDIDNLPGDESKNVPRPADGTGESLQERQPVSALPQTPTGE